MSQKLEKDLKDYYSKIKELSLHSGKAQKEILEKLKASINEYLADNPACSIADITHRFGTPEDIAQADLLNEDGEEAAKRIRRNRMAKRVVLWGTIIVAIVGCIIFASVIVHNYNVSGGYSIAEALYTNSAIYKCSLEG